MEKDSDFNLPPWFAVILVLFIVLAILVAVGFLPTCGRDLCEQCNGLRGEALENCVLMECFGRE